MNKEEREQIIMLIHLKTAYALSYLESLTDEQLKRLNNRVFEN